MLVSYLKSSPTHSLFFGLLILLSIGCGEKNGGDGNSDQFDRAAMLADWADLQIIPAYTAYLSALEELSNAKNQFYLEETSTSFATFKVAYITAYASWQTVAMFEIGKAEEIGLRNFTNIYPTDVDEILANINSQNVALDLPSQFDAQGFPALDYLLYGSANSEEEIIDFLQEEVTERYIDLLVSRLQDLTQEVLDDWQGEYRSLFVANDGSSSTASVDKMVNDYIFYYERFLRAGKIGLPAGVFTGSELPDLVEAPYSQIYSKDLLSVALEATEKFFNGDSFDGQVSGISLADYLDGLESESAADIAMSINTQWTVIDNQLAVIDDNLYHQVETDHGQMLLLRDELQKNVITLKVDMLSALNIQVDYVDADGD